MAQMQQPEGSEESSDSSDDGDAAAVHTALSSGSFPDVPGAPNITRLAYSVQSRTVPAMRMAISAATLSGELIGLKTFGGNHKTSKVSPPPIDVPRCYSRAYSTCPLP